MTGEGNRIFGRLLASLDCQSSPDLAANSVDVSRTQGKAVAPQILILSAPSQEDLDEATESLRVFLEGGKADIARVACALRSVPQWPFRRAVVWAGREDAIVALTGKRSSRVATGVVTARERPIAFLLPGIGDQYVGMASGLYEESVEFRADVDRCSGILQSLIDCDIRTILYPPGGRWKVASPDGGMDLKRMLGRSADDPPDPDSERLNSTSFSQPALFVVEYAMARHWGLRGVSPNYLVGHSMGEYVAACLSGVLSLEDALRLVATRARLVNALPQAVMLAVMLPEQKVLPRLEHEVCLSLINGPEHCVVAGPPEAVQRLERELNDEGVIARRVQNGHAFHTRWMEPIVPAFRAELQAVTLSQPRIPYISNVSGCWITASDATDPEYWIRHLTQTARFSDALGELWRLENPLLIECGPGRTLTVLANQHPGRSGPLRPAITSIRQRYEGETDQQVLLTALGRAWVAGAPVQWSHVAAENGVAREQEVSGATDDARVISKAGDLGGTGTLRPHAAFAGEGDTATAPIELPTSERERELVAIWSRALGRDDVGVNDSFGALGGDSLSSVGALLEMKRVGVPDEVSRGLYRGLTIREMVAAEASAGGGARGIPKVNGVPVGSLETPVFLRALGIYLVMASHFGLTTFEGNPVLIETPRHRYPRTARGNLDGCRIRYRLRTGHGSPHP